jgi:MFS family permease
MEPVKQERWLRIIPVALIMYTISYIDRTNVALASDANLSTMMKDIFLMDDKIKGNAIGIFFFGYLLLQIPGGYLANRWSARKLVSIFLVLWGACAIGCGLVSDVTQFKVMRFLLGVAESGVFPATLVLLSNWFPRQERARANAYWNLCQPLAVAGAAPITGALLGTWGWRTALILEGALPLVWLPIWWFFISDQPREAKWISREEREYLETTLAREASQLAPPGQDSLWASLFKPAVLAAVVVMVPIYFLQNCAAYGCNTFLSEALKSPTKFSGRDILNLPSLAARLRQHSDAVSKFIWDRCSKAGQQMLAANSGNGADVKPLQAAVVRELNQVILGGPLYEEERFAAVTLCAEARALLGKNPRGDALARLNLLLLVDAYPAEIAKSRASFTPLQTGLLYAVPYLVTVVVMVVTSRHSDKTQERRGHVAVVYGVAGLCLIASVVASRYSFWLSYGFLCFAIQGPFAGLAPFWAIPAETMPRVIVGVVMGLVNAFGNIGGWAGNYTFGWLKKTTGGTAIPFSVLGGALLLGAALALLLPKRKAEISK